MIENLSITLVSDLTRDYEGVKTLIYSISKKTDITKVNIITNYEGNQIYELNEIASTLNLEVKFIKIDNFLNEIKIIDSFESIKHISNFAFAKFLVFEKIVEPTLYLDSDILIMKSVELKKEFSKLGNGIFFVRNAYFNFKSSLYWKKRYEGIYKNVFQVRRYAFNSGVFLINASANEKKLYFESLLNSLKENNFTFMDQSHFNFVFKNKCKFLPLKYNWPVHNSHMDIVKKSDKLFLHFASKEKPWNSRSNKSSSEFKEWLAMNDELKKILNEKN